MRKCIDCRHIKRSCPGVADCARKGNVVNPRTGLTESNPLCVSEREDSWPFYYLFGSCGRRGRFFEPKRGRPTADDEGRRP